jgi:hypothetical protein
MKFLQYIIAEKRNLIHFEPPTMFADMESVLENDCKPYFKLLKGKPPLFRAVSDMVPMNAFLKKSVRQSRHPLGTDPTVFKRFNKWLRDNGHVRRDQAVSTTPKKDQFFGVPYYFFPLGKFSYTWVRSRDVNKTDPSTGWNTWSVDIMFGGSKIPSDELSPETLKKHEEITFNFDKYFMTNKGFQIAYKKNYEIWFECKEYYLVNPEDYYLIGRI